MQGQARRPHLSTVIRARYVEVEEIVGREQLGKVVGGSGSRKIAPSD
jgi:hypothetical protein